jgi:hypothetical protein
MTRFGKLIGGAALAAATLIGTTALTATAADARVHIGIGIGVPGPGYGGGYYGRGYYPPGPCASYNYYYEGNCGYDAYDDPVYVDGVWLNGPHYYRYWGGQPYVWYRGGWHNGFRGGAHWGGGHFGGHAHGGFGGHGGSGHHH